ncbi:hypothetical protein CLV59_107128 [Chitinophaga dinghuensis]|uniref:N-acetyltransferase domain-containing protein n=1 Tax=Chitinophaga dinghuensis TaxID=1539050 RepID=A0A327VQ50_9BACT|nr:GNAT family N-acetyltransferase [Chitinophaga dinghuensis]RAJ77361.1 hypothetical protein CLV59_107128 [Chitinophaga dinghuensis]
MNIITKFTVVTEQGMEALLMLTKELAIEKYSTALEKKVLDRYIAQQFNKQALVAAINNISNQWLVVYADNEPAGYACITSKGTRPAVLENKRAARIRDFGVLKKYTAPEISASLLEKCLTVCKAYDHLWIMEYADSPLVGIFEQKGFIRQPGNEQLGELPLASVFLMK